LWIESRRYDVYMDRSPVACGEMLSCGNSRLKLYIYIYIYTAPPNLTGLQQTRVLPLSLMLRSPDKFDRTAKLHDSPVLLRRIWPDRKTTYFTALADAPQSAVRTNLTGLQKTCVLPLLLTVHSPDEFDCTAKTMCCTALADVLQSGRIEQRHRSSVNIHTSPGTQYTCISGGWGGWGWVGGGVGGVGWGGMGRGVRRAGLGEIYTSTIIHHFR
jgi:hypothetical protein